jgi:hypothetical protein
VGIADDERLSLDVLQDGNGLSLGAISERGVDRVCLVTESARGIGEVLVDRFKPLSELVVAGVDRRIGFFFRHQWNSIGLTACLSIAVYAITLL